MSNRVSLLGSKITLDDIKDSEILEDFFQTQVRNKNTKRAINDTYGEKKPTKARHILSGKRKWKNKKKVYATLNTSMLVTEFNKRGDANEAQQRMIKRMSDKRKKLSLQED